MMLLVPLKLLLTEEFLLANFNEFIQFEMQDSSGYSNSMHCILLPFILKTFFKFFGVLLN